MRARASVSRSRIAAQRDAPSPRTSGHRGRSSCRRRSRTRRPAALAPSRSDSRPTTSPRCTTRLRARPAPGGTSRPARARTDDGRSTSRLVPRKYAEVSRRQGERQRLPVDRPARSRRGTSGCRAGSRRARARTDPPAPAPTLRHLDAAVQGVDVLVGELSCSESTKVSVAGP